MQRASKPLQKAVDHSQMLILKNMGWQSPLRALWQSQDYDDEASRIAQHIFAPPWSLLQDQGGNYLMPRCKSMCVNH